MTKPYENTKTEKWIPEIGETIRHKDGTLYRVLDNTDLRLEVKNDETHSRFSAPVRNFRPVSDPTLDPADALEICKKRREEHIAENSKLRAQLKTVQDTESDYKTRIERQEAAIRSLQAELKVARQTDLNIAYLDAENAKLQTAVVVKNNLLEKLREDQAAAEDHYQQEIDKLNRIIGTFQNYVERLEDGIK